MGWIVGGGAGAIALIVAVVLSVQGSSADSDEDTPPNGERTANTNPAAEPSEPSTPSAPQAKSTDYYVGRGAVTGQLNGAILDGQLYVRFTEGHPRVDHRYVFDVQLHFDGTTYGHVHLEPNSEELVAGLDAIDGVSLPFQRKLNPVPAGIGVSFDLKSTVTDAADAVHTFRVGLGRVTPPQPSGSPNPPTPVPTVAQLHERLASGDKPSRGPFEFVGTVLMEPKPTTDGRFAVAFGTQAHSVVCRFPGQPPVEMRKGEAYRIRTEFRDEVKQLRNPETGEEVAAIYGEGLDVREVFRVLRPPPQPGNTSPPNTSPSPAAKPVEALALLQQMQREGDAMVGRTVRVRGKVWFHSDETPRSIMLFADGESFIHLTLSTAPEQLAEKGEVVVAEGRVHSLGGPLKNVVGARLVERNVKADPAPTGSGEDVVASTELAANHRKYLGRPIRVRGMIVGLGLRANEARVSLKGAEGRVVTLDLRPKPGQGPRDLRFGQSVTTVATIAVADASGPWLRDFESLEVTGKAPDELPEPEFLSVTVDQLIARSADPAFADSLGPPGKKYPRRPIAVSGTVEDVVVREDAGAQLPVVVTLAGENGRITVEMHHSDHADAFAKGEPGRAVGQWSFQIPGRINLTGGTPW